MLPFGGHVVSEIITVLVVPASCIIEHVCISAKIGNAFIVFGRDKAITCELVFGLVLHSTEPKASTWNS